MSNIITIKNVRAYLDETGTAQINLEDAARGLGFTETAASGNEVVRWARVRGYLADFGFIATCGDGNNIRTIPVGSEMFIPENIFYRLAMRAKNAVAEKFQALVADEILPSIRKNGMYLTPKTSSDLLDDPATFLARAVLVANEQIAKKEAELHAARESLAIAQPKAEAWETVAEDEGFLVSAEQIAKTAALPGLKVSSVRELLRELNILCKEKNEITADAQRKGYGRNILESIELGNGRRRNVIVPKFRGKAIDLVVTHWKQKSGRLF